MTGSEVMKYCMSAEMVILSGMATGAVGITDGCGVTATVGRIDARRSTVCGVIDARGSTVDGAADDCGVNDARGSTGDRPWMVQSVMPPSQRQYHSALNVMTRFLNAARDVEDADIRTVTRAEFIRYALR